MSDDTKSAPPNIESMHARLTEALERYRDTEARGAGTNVNDLFAIARAIERMDALLREGQALPAAWRAATDLSPADLLTWWCKRVWSRLHGETVTIGFNERETLSNAFGEPLAFETRNLLVGTGIPRAVGGETRERALVLAISWGVWRTRALHGADDRIARDATDVLEDLGFSVAPRNLFRVDEVLWPCEPMDCCPRPASATLRDAIPKGYLER